MELLYLILKVEKQSSYTCIPYKLIAMWIYPTVPNKMVMVLVIIFGAHLLPFG